MSESAFESACRALLLELGQSLLARQVTDPADADRGAIHDAACGARHSRAAEAVFPFAVLGRDTGDARWGAAAAQLGDWLVERQEAEGSWYETPGRTWRGTTADQMLSLALALPILEPSLGAERAAHWKRAVTRAADFLAGWISEETAHVNYLATTAAALAVAHGLTKSPSHALRARQLARLVALEKITPGGFVTGEGHRKDGRTHGVDPGYAVDMTLWSLVLAGRLLDDGEVVDAAARSLAVHLDFVYPDGHFDNSWGTRSNKWTGYGSKTANGMQIGYGILAAGDARFAEAASRNLAFLRERVLDGLVGPFFGTPNETCLYPTFTRAMNLALALDFGEQPPAGDTGALPCDAPFARAHPDVNLAVVRTGGLMATVCAYGYTVPRDREKNKYMARPSGGGVTNLWLDGWGWLQVGTAAQYKRWEPMHFPEAHDPQPLTARLEQVRAAGVCSSQNEFEAKLVLESTDAPVTTRATGVVRDLSGRAGSLKYEWTHRFEERAVTKELVVRAGILGGRARLVEPVVLHPRVRVHRLDGRTVELRRPENETGPRSPLAPLPAARVRLTLEQGEGEWIVDDDKIKYWWPMPAIQGMAITLELGSLRPFTTLRLIYRFEKLD
jgi:hypothetical protein